MVLPEPHMKNFIQKGGKVRKKVLLSQRHWRRVPIKWEFMLPSLLYQSEKVKATWRDRSLVYMLEPEDDQTLQTRRSKMRSKALHDPARVLVPLAPPPPNSDSRVGTFSASSVGITSPIV